MGNFILFILFLFLGVYMVTATVCNYIIEVEAPECFSPQKMCFEQILYKCNDGAWEIEKDCLGDGGICLIENGITYCRQAY